MWVVCMRRLSWRLSWLDHVSQEYMALLTKKDVARRQLATAIRLFFDECDSVSVYSLAANAWEVIDALCDQNSILSISRETREHIPSDRDLKRDYINSPYRNFFKHADRDPDAILPSFDESSVDSVIFLAVEDYLRLFKKSPVEFQVFQLWYLAINIEKLSSDTFKEILDSVESTFPNIRNLPRSERIAIGRILLDEALQDQIVLDDPRTEPHF
jgi:hypothetical protein